MINNNYMGNNNYMNQNNFGQMMNPTMNNNYYLVKEGEKVNIVSSKRNNSVDIKNIKYFTHSLSVGGYKAVDSLGNTLFKWGLYWENGSRLGDDLEKQGVKFVLRNNN